MKPMQILIWIDQGFNVMLGGWADETISARAYRQHTHKTHWYVAMRVIDAVFFWQTRHCMQSYQAERKRHQLPAEYRDNLIEESHF
jgi:hypothetical protein